MQIYDQKEVKTHYFSLFRFLLVVKFPFKVVLRPKMRNFRQKNFCLRRDVRETEIKAKDTQFFKQELLPMHRLHC